MSPAHVAVAKNIKSAVVKINNQRGDNVLVFERGKQDLKILSAKLNDLSDSL